MSRRDWDPTSGCGCLLVSLVAWFLIAGGLAQWIAGPEYPEWLFYGIAAAPFLLLLWMLRPFKR